MGRDSKGERDAASQSHIHPDACPCPPGSPLAALKHRQRLKVPTHGEIKCRVLSQALLTICLSGEPKRDFRIALVKLGRGEVGKRGPQAGRLLQANLGQKIHAPPLAAGRTPAPLPHEHGNDGLGKAEAVSAQWCRSVGAQFRASNLSSPVNKTPGIPRQTEDP